MPFTDDELQSLYSDLSHVDYQTPALVSLPDETTQAQAVPWKFPKQIANIIPGAINSLVSGAVGLGQSLQDSDAQTSDADLAGIKSPLPTFNVGPTNTIPDLLLNKVAPEIAGLAIPYEGVLKGVTALGNVGKFAELPLLARIAGEGLAQGATNALASPDTAAQSGAMGLASGALQQGLPRWARALPLAAVSYAGTGGDPLGTALNTGLNLLPGFHGDINVTQPKLSATNPFDSLSQPQLPYNRQTPLQLPYSSDPNFTTPDTILEGQANRVPFDPNAQQINPQPINPNAPQLPYASDPNFVFSNGDLHFPDSNLTGTDTTQFRLGQSEQPVANSGISFDPNAPDTSGLNLFQQPELPLGYDNSINPKPSNLKLAGDLPDLSQPELPINAKYNLIDNPELAGVKPDEQSLFEGDQVQVTMPDGTEHEGIINGADENGNVQLLKENGNTVTLPEQHAGEPPISTEPTGQSSESGEVQTTPDESTPESQSEGLQQNANAPQVMTPAGDLTTLPARMEGSHIISTVLDEGDGQYLSGDTWNSPHQKGEGNIFQSQIDNATGIGKSAFLIQDENGVQRVTQDRLEAAKFAEIAGQRKPETVGSGPLQSEDLQDPLPKTQVDTPAPQQILQKEKVTDAQTLVSAKNIQSKIDDHLSAIQFAKEEMKETGDPSFAAEIRARSMEVAKLRKMQQGQAGSVSPEAAIVLAAAGIGGLVAYQQSKGDIGATLAGAVIMAGLGYAGVKALKDFKLKVGSEANLENAKTIKAFVKATSETKAGMAIGGRGGIIANSARTAEQLLGFGSDFFRDSEIRASGWVQDQVNQLQAEFNKIRDHQPTSGFLDSAKSFFRGQLANKVDVNRILESGGISEADYNALAPKDKLAYPEKWFITGDPNSTNYKVTNKTSLKDADGKPVPFDEGGNQLQTYHVSNDAKSQLKQLQSQALLRSVGSDADKEMIPFFQKAYDTRDTMMQMMHSALPPGEFRNTVIGTSGQYATRSFDAILDPNYYPTEQAIQNRMSELSSNMEGKFLDRYGSDVSRPGSIPIQDSTGKTSYIDPKQKTEWDNLHTPESLHAYVRQEISDIKQAGKSWKGSAVSSDDIQYNGGLFTGRKELTDAALTLYGERTNAFQNINDTISKLSPLTRSSIQMKNLAGQIEARTGLKYAYNDTIDFNKEVNGIKDQLKTDPNNKLLHTKLAELQSYQPLSSQNPKFGMFQGAMVSRTAYDSINGMEGVMGALDNTFGKSMLAFNQLVKDTHLTANPITQVRNMLQIPMFLAMGGAATSFDHMLTVGKMLWHGDFSSLVARELVQQGCFEGNPVVAEFKRSINDLVTGKADQDIATSLISKGWDMAQKLYAYPDNFVRGVTYLAAKERFAKVAGVSLEDANSDIQAQARNFMTRRTLDYGAAPQIVKIGRQIPFVSMYLTYTQQIMKIAKNMAVDTMHGDFQAGATLAAFGSIPFVAQNLAESKLSPQDLIDWNNTQKVVQAYSRPRFKMPLSRNVDGSFNYLDITALSHFNDFQMMARAVKNNDWKSFFAVNPLVSTDNTPLLSLASDQIQGKDSHTGRTFRDTTIGDMIGDRAMNIAKEILPPWVPGIGYDWEKSMPESLGGKLGVTNFANARTETIQGALIRHTLGADYTQISPGIAMKNYVNSAKEQIANEKQYLMDTLKSNISDDAKKRATSKFVEAVGIITQNMQARLQTQTP